MYDMESEVLREQLREVNLELLTTKSQVFPNLGIPEGGIKLLQCIKIMFTCLFGKHDWRYNQFNTKRICNRCYKVEKL